jgi:hypothetical protein
MCLIRKAAIKSVLPCHKDRTYTKAFNRLLFSPLSPTGGEGKGEGKVTDVKTKTALG